MLTAIPERVRTRYTAGTIATPSTAPTAGQRALGEVVQLRDLREYEEIARRPPKPPPTSVCASTSPT